MSPLKPGAWRSIEELHQATEELQDWKARYHRLIHDCYRLGWSRADIARVAQCHPRTVSNHLHREERA